MYKWFQVRVCADRGDPFFNLANSRSSVLDGACFEKPHPSLVSVSRSAFDQFASLRGTLSGYVVLSLHFSAHYAEEDLGESEGFPCATSDPGAEEVLALAGPELYDLSASSNTRDAALDAVIAVSACFAFLHGIGPRQSRCRVRCLDHRVIGLRSVTLAPFCELSEEEFESLKEAILEHSPAVIQGSLIFLPRRAPVALEGARRSCEGLSLQAVQNSWRNKWLFDDKYAAAFVLDTSDLLKGVVTRHTDVYVLKSLGKKGDALEAEEANGRSWIDFFFGFKWREQTTDGHQVPVVSDFPGELSPEKKRPIFAVPFRIPLQQPENSDRTLSVLPLAKTCPCLFDARVLRTPLSGSLGSGEYLEAEVGMDLRAMRKCQITNGTWVLIKTEHTSNAYQQIGRIRAIDEGVDGMRVEHENVLYVSPSMAFNLRLGELKRPAVTISPVHTRVEAALKHSRRGMDADGERADPWISLAREAHILKIASAENDPAFYRRCLHEYFRTPRIMREGDLFCIVLKRPRYLATADDGLGEESELVEDDLGWAGSNHRGHLPPSEIERDEYTESDSPSLTVYPEEDELASRICYFRLDRATPLSSKTEPSFFIVCDATTVYQDGTVNSRVVSDHVFFVQRADPFLKWTNSSIEFKFPPPGLEKQASSISSLLRPCVHPLATDIGLQVSVLLSGQSGCGKTYLVRSLAAHLGVHLLERSSSDLVKRSNGRIDASLHSVFLDAIKMAPCILCIDGIELFERAHLGDGDHTRFELAVAKMIKDGLGTLMQHQKKSRWPVVLVATSGDSGELSKTLRACFSYEVTVGIPDESARLDILRCATAQCCVYHDVSLEEVAKETSYFTMSDLVALVQRAGSEAVERVVSSCNRGGLLDCLEELTPSMEEDLCCVGLAISRVDFERACEHMNAWKSNSLGFGLYRIPKVKWEDIGGLQEAKKEILDTIQLPVLHPELFSEGVQHRSGVLLYGPPGTGKTLLAKAVATECRLNFISVKGPELLSMYIGLSEKNIRDIFERASNAQPCVVFFDELDSLAPKRGIHGDSGGVTDRIVSQLLAELSGIGRTSQIFVIGATNRPDLIEPSLLVPGRFDKLIYLGGHQTVDQRLHVLRAQTKNFCLGKTVDLVDLAEKCPSNLTGADMYALCSNALYLAIGSRVREYRGLSPEDLEGLKADSSLSVRVEQQHFISALEKLAPSMTFSELKRYDAIRERFESRVRPVD